MTIPQRRDYRVGERVLVEGTIIDWEYGVPFGAVTVRFEAATDPSRVVLVDPGPPDATARAIAEAMARLADALPCACGPLLDQPAARRALGEALLRAVALGAGRETDGVPGSRQ